MVLYNLHNTNAYSNKPNLFTSIEKAYAELHKMHSDYRKLYIVEEIEVDTYKTPPSLMKPIPYHDDW